MAGKEKITALPHSPSSANLPQKPRRLPMPSNNRVELTGFLGKDAKLIEKNGKKFVALNVATTDSYKDDSDQWQDKESVWHDALVFRPAAVQFAEKLKKGDKVELIGSLSYKLFKDENGVADTFRVYPPDYWT